MTKTNMMILILSLYLLCLFPHVSISDETQNGENSDDRLIKVEVYSINWDRRFLVAMTVERLRTFQDVKHFSYKEPELLLKIEKTVDQFVDQFFDQGKYFGSSRVDTRVLFELYYSSGKQTLIAFSKPHILTFNGVYCFDKDGILVPFGELLPGKQGERFKEYQGQFVDDKERGLIRRKDAEGPFYCVEKVYICLTMELFYQAQQNYRDDHGRYADLHELNVSYSSDTGKFHFSNAHKFLNSRLVDPVYSLHIENEIYRLFLQNYTQMNSFLLTSDGKIRRHHEFSLNIDDYQELVIDLSKSPVKEHFHPF